jgi:hypothetical protein
VSCSGQAVYISEAELPQYLQVPASWVKSILAFHSCQRYDQLAFLQLRIDVKSQASDQVAHVDQAHQ